MNLHHNTPLSRAAKRCAPWLSRIVTQPSIARGVRLLEAYLAILQGKGAGGGWDLVSEAHVAARYLPEGEACVFDVGANRGHWSEEIRRLRPGKRTRFFQFEPSQFCQGELKAHADADTVIIGEAVGDQIGTVSFFVPEAGSTISSVHQQRDTYFQDAPFHEEKVPMTTIDHVVEKHHVARVDFMKIDVEGNELAVLRGAKNTFQARKIKALAFEFGSPQINARGYFHDFWDMLNPLGFQFLRICPGGLIIPVAEYYEDLEYFRGATNYVAILSQESRS
jgi:FkbM family methyltransferase